MSDPEHGEGPEIASPEAPQTSVAAKPTDSLDSTDGYHSFGTLDPHVEVRAYVQRIFASNQGRPPLAGSPDWCELGDGSPAKLLAVLVAGSRWVLESDLAAREDRRHALKDAAVEVSDAADWSAVAKRVRDRDAAIRSGAYIERVVA